MNWKLQPWLAAAALAAIALFRYPGRVYALDGMMLFFPLLDPCWRPPGVPLVRRHVIGWSLVLLSVTALLIWRPGYLSYSAAMLLTAALPEEWFFRAYFMTRAGQGWQANIAASLLFSLMHGITWGWIAAVLVFIPSLFYGWLYQRTRDLPLLILAHALSNIVFMMFLAGFIERWLPVTVVR